MGVNRLFSLNKKKKVGIAGWWGGKNEGDLYIINVLKKAFSNKFDVIPINIPFRNNNDPIRYFNKLDFLLIGGGGLFTLNFPPPFNNYNEWGGSLKTPFGFLGLGVQEISEKQRQLFSDIVSNSLFFAVRDTGSYDVAIQYTNMVDKIADLTFLCPRKIEVDPNRSKLGVNLRIWNFDENRTYNNAIWCEAINNLKYNKVKIPLSFLKELKDSAAMDKINAINSPKFNMDLYKNINTMVGMRLHSLIFAIQNSIPVIGISYTPKIKRLFNDIGLQEFILEVNESQKLSQLVERTVDESEWIKKRLAEYTESSRQLVSDYINKVVAIVSNL
jgi:polysaccharide pyruvyl transferase WcaK-like protein